MKKWSLFLLLLLITACGFEPLYVKKQASDNTWYFGGQFDRSITDEMAEIKIETISDRFGQLVRNNLLDIVTPLGNPKSPKYRLYVDPEETEITQQALRKDITATRERVRYKVKYRLVETSSGREILKGDSLNYVSYDILANPYSTTMAQKKTEEDSAKIIANDISLRLAAYFHREISRPGEGK